MKSALRLLAEARVKECPPPAVKGMLPELAGILDGGSAFMQIVAERVLDENLSEEDRVAEVDSIYTTVYAIQVALGQWLDSLDEIAIAAKPGALH